MKDWIFFPLALLTAAAFVIAAINPTDDRPPTGPVSGGGQSPEDVTVSGEDLHRFVTGDFGGLSFETVDGALVLRITRQVEQVYDSPRSGPHLVLAEDLEGALSSRLIEVIIEARSSGDFPASLFEASYLALAGEGGESGWKEFTLTREFAPYTFQWETPTRKSGQGYDFIGVRPVTPDKRRTMEIRSIRVHAAGPKRLRQLNIGNEPIR